MRERHAGIAGRKAALLSVICILLVAGCSRSARTPPPTYTATPPSPGQVAAVASAPAPRTTTAATVPSSKVSPPTPTAALPAATATEEPQIAVRKALVARSLSLERDASFPSAVVRALMIRGANVVWSTIPGPPPVTGEPDPAVLVRYAQIVWTTRPEHPPPLGVELPTVSQVQPVRQQVHGIVNDANLSDSEKQQELTTLQHTVGDLLFIWAIKSIPIYDDVDQRWKTTGAYVTDFIVRTGGDPESGTLFERDPIGTAWHLLIHGPPDSDTLIEWFGDPTRR